MSKKKRLMEAGGKWLNQLRGKSKARPDQPAKPDEPSQPVQSSKLLVRFSANEKLAILNPIRSVGAKLLLFFFIGIVVFVGAVGMYSYNESKKIIEDEVAGFSVLATQQTAEKLKMVFEQYENISMRFLVDQTIMDQFTAYIQTADNSFQQLEAMQALESSLQSFTFSDNSIRSIYLFSDSGEQIVGVGNTGAFAQSVYEEPWFQNTIEADGRVYWIPSQAEGIGGLGGASFGLSRSVKNISTGDIQFVLLIEIDYDVLQKQMAGLNLGEGGTRSIIDTQGNIIYSDDVEELGKPSPFRITKSGDQFNAMDSYTADNAKGESSLVSFSRSSENNDWYVVASVPVSELTENAGQILQTTVVAIIIAAVVAIFVGMYMMWSIGRPLILLRNLMNEGEKGNLSVRIQMRRKDEIGQVGFSFNRMMEQITRLVKQTNQSADEVLETAGELSAVSKNTAMSAKEISVASEQIAEGASTLAVQAENGNEISLDIRNRMRNVVDTNLELGRSADLVLGVSDKGIRYMNELIAKTDQTEQITRSMVEKVEKLKESTSSIRKILDVLNNITSQTNILSLNATIEAARAGAAGRGFMVVADEIRKLADQSRQSIDVVGQITEKIQQEIDETVKFVSEVYPLFQEQMASVKETDQIFGQVREQMGEFIRKLDEVTQSIQDLDQAQAVLADAISNVSSVSEESSATSEEVASLTSQQMHASEGLVVLAEKLEKLSKGLKESLSQFKYD